MNTPTIRIYVDSGDELALPAKYEVCPTCQGRGRHVNPAIEPHGLTQEDFDEEGPEFFDDYMSGVYDVQCQECRGERVVAVIDRDSCSPEQLRCYEASCRELAEMRALEAAERRMGA